MQILSVVRCTVSQTNGITCSGSRPMYMSRPNSSLKFRTIRNWWLAPHRIPPFTTYYTYSCSRQLYYFTMVVLNGDVCLQIIEWSIAWNWVFFTLFLSFFHTLCSIWEALTSGVWKVHPCLAYQEHPLNLYNKYNVKNWSVLPREILSLTYWQFYCCWSKWFLLQFPPQFFSFLCWYKSVLDSDIKVWEFVGVFLISFYCKCKAYTSPQLPSCPISCSGQPEV